MSAANIAWLCIAVIVFCGWASAVWMARRNPEICAVVAGPGGIFGLGALWVIIYDVAILCGAHL